ncbi:MAG: N-acetylmuramoyl-L-alanine amidase, partial [Oscillospiraceae bacterium]
MEVVSNAACCISCHMDAGKATASGMTIWLHSNAPKRYVDWSQDVLDELKRVGFTSNRSTEINKGYRGDPNTNYAWNRQTRSPSMLLELGFITNAANLKEFDENYKDYAQAVVNATCRFIGVQRTNAEQSSDNLLADLQALMNKYTK